MFMTDRAPVFNKWRKKEQRVTTEFCWCTGELSFTARRQTGKGFCFSVCEFACTWLIPRLECTHKCEHAQNRSLMCICRQLLRRALQKLHLSGERVGVLHCYAWRAHGEAKNSLYFVRLFDPCRRESTESGTRVHLVCMHTGEVIGLEIWFFHIDVYMNFLFNIITWIVSQMIDIATIQYIYIFQS